MNRYEISPPRSRAAFGFAAFALTALTIGVAVVLPARYATAAADTPVTAVSRPADAGRVEVVISPARVDVVAERVRKAALEPVARRTPTT